SVAAVLSLVGGARRGDAASLLTGAGGAASSVAQIPELAKAIPGLGTAGTILTGLGGLASLFHSGQAKVTARLDEESLAKMRDIMQIPQNVSVVVVGGASDPR